MATRISQSDDIGKVDPGAAERALAKVIIDGDLSKMSEVQRVDYYNAVCRSVGLNPLTKPLEYIRLNGKLTLYAKKDCTDQLRTIHDVSVTIVDRTIDSELAVVVARAVNAKGRQDEDIGAVPIAGLKGEARANAIMKAGTKAKRRVTLSICGLGFLDESELDGIPPDRMQRPPPALSREAAATMSLEADKVEMVKDQLGAIHTKDELDAYLGESRLRAWMDRLERNRRNHPEVYEGVALAVAACRARVDPASREDGADLPGGEDAPDAGNDDPPETLPFFAPDPENPETWKLYAVEAEGGMSVAQAWRDLWWKACLRAMPDQAARLLQENEAHLDAIAARGGEYEAAVIVVRRAAEQARMAPVADRTPVADGSEVAAS